MTLHIEIASLHHLDIESIIAILIILIISQLHGKQIIVYSKRIAKFLDYVLDEKILREVDVSHTDKRPLPTLFLSYVHLDLAIRERPLRLRRPETYKPSFQRKPSTGNILQRRLYVRDINVNNMETQAWKTVNCSKVHSI